ncbi:MAG: hypothetical protein AB4911_14970 [Oscillochloridaceae bacterium umkhey_bin13]
METVTHYQFAFSPAVIVPLLDLHHQLGPAYGLEEPQILAEEQLAGYQLQVLLCYNRAGWALIARSTPPLVARVALTTGLQAVRQAFDEHGEATFAAVDEQSLRTGFDLVIELSA